MPFPIHVAVIRQTYAFHTGPDKRWPDICYHFMISPDGAVWETRSGSLAGPVVADATGGNQGYAQLVCMIGDFTGTAPTPRHRNLSPAHCSFSPTATTSTPTRLLRPPSCREDRTGSARAAW